MRLQSHNSLFNRSSTKVVNPIQEVESKSSAVVCVIKSGVIASHSSVQPQALPDAGVNLRPPVDLDRGDRLLVIPSNGQAKD